MLTFVWFDQFFDVPYMVRDIAYLSAAAGVIHYLRLVKSDIRLPEFHRGLLALALLLRIPMCMNRTKAA